MSNVFGILTAIVLALSAFVAFKNQAAYQGSITATQTAKDTLGKSQVRLKVDKEKLEALPKERAEVDAEVEKFTAEESAAQKTVATLKTDIESKTKKISESKEKLDDIRAKTEKTGDLTELASKMRATKAELEELTQSISVSEAKLANLTSQNSSAESQIAKVKSEFENYSNGQSLPALNTRIRSIYPNWGFVTLAAGNNAGVVANSTLNVVRDGQTIASLLVTGVESGTSSASIIPDSLGQDVTLMVGDRVVPGVKEPKPVGN